MYSKARPNHLAETLCGNAVSFSKFTSCVPCVSSASVYVMCIRPLHMRLLPSSAYLQQQKNQTTLLLSTLHFQVPFEYNITMHLILSHCTMILL